MKGEISEHRGVLNRNWRTVTVVCAMTIAFEMFFYMLGQSYSSGNGGLMMLLGAAMIWSAISVPAVAAGPSCLWDRIIRGGCVADCTFIVFCFAWIFEGGDGFSFMSVVKCYCVIASVVLLICMAVMIPLKLWCRYAVAVAVSGIIILSLLSPLWVNSMLDTVDDYDSKSEMVAWAVRINPFFAMCNSVGGDTGFAWTEANWMYSYTAVGEDIPVGEIEWYQTVILYLSIAALLCVAMWVRRRGDSSAQCV